MSTKSAPKAETITVDAKHLHAALTRAVGAVESRKTYPILQCVRIAVDGDELEITATDLDAVARIRIPVTGNCDPICIESTRLIEIARQLAGRGDIDLAFTPSPSGGVVCKASSGRSHFTLDTLSTAQWPELSVPQEVAQFRLSGKLLADIFSALAPAIFTGEGRAYLAGINLAPGSIASSGAPETLTAVAINGHMAYARQLAVPGLPRDMASIIVPRVTCACIAKLFGDMPEIDIAVCPDKIIVRGGTTVYLSKLIEGVYPDWRRVTPTAPPTHSYDAAALIRSIDLASAATKSSKTAGQPVKLTFGDGETTIAARDLNQPGFTGADVCPHSLIGDAEVAEIGVSADYLAEMLRKLDAETIEMSFPTNERSPIKITGATLSDRVITIMPMRV